MLFRFFSNAKFFGILVYYDCYLLFDYRTGGFTVKKYLCVVLASVFLVACAGEPTPPPSDVEIASASGSQPESRTQEVLPAQQPFPALPEEAYATPEAAITAYIEGIAAADLGKAFAACATQSYGEGYDVREWVALMQHYRVGSDLGPSDYDLYGDLNAMMQLGMLAGQTKVFVECLTAGSKSQEAATLQAKGGWSGEESPGESMEAYFGWMNPDGLQLAVEEIITPPILDPATAEVTDVLDRNAKLAGAEESTQRVVILNLGDQRAICGFQLLRYGDDWKIASHGSPLLNIVSTGYTLLVTPEEVGQFKQEVLNMA